MSQEVIKPQEALEAYREVIAYLPWWFGYERDLAEQANTVNRFIKQEAERQQTCESKGQGGGNGKTA